MRPARKTPIEREFIRHPSHMPIRFDLQGDIHDRQEVLRNVSEGGLCFASGVAMEAGQSIRLTIPVLGQMFEVAGVVAWCRTTEAGHEVGVRFLSQQDRFCVRMVEQLCYIEEYRAEVERVEGRRISSEQAASEWVERFAETFPKLQ